jgi:ABC-type transport system involved in multi-copper enzyme maturation permease subunit
MKHFIQKLLTLNPIIIKELRSRFRGKRAFITLTVSLAATGAVLAGVLALLISISMQRANSITSPQAGQLLFSALAFVEMVVVCAVTPALTAESISSEKERQTFDLLLATPLNTTSILWGKLISALSFVFLLIFAAIPLASLVYLFGGVSIWLMARSLLVLIATTLFLGSLGMFFSALLGRSGRATILSFLSVAFLVFVPMILMLVTTIINYTMASNGQTPSSPRWFLPFSPALALWTASISDTSFGQYFGIFTGIGADALKPVSMTSIPRPIFHYSLALYLGLALLFFYLSAAYLNPLRRWRLSRQDVISALVAFLLLGAGSAGVYFATTGHYENYRPPQVDPTTIIVDPSQPGIMNIQPALPNRIGGGGGGGGDEPDLTATPTALPSGSEDPSPTPSAIPAP